MVRNLLVLTCCTNSSYAGQTSQGLVQSLWEKCIVSFSDLECKTAKTWKWQTMKVVAHNEVSAIVIAYRS